MTNTKRGFKCTVINDKLRAEGIIEIDKVYPVSETISEDYILVISDDGRGFSLIPSQGGKWVNAGEPFAEFVAVALPVDDSDVVYLENTEVQEGAGDE